MKEVKMKIIDIDINKLIPYENNPRFNDDAVEPLMKSIEMFGFKVPIVVDSNNVIVCGHTRYKAGLKLGLKKIPSIVADDLNDDQINAFRLVDNKTAEFAEWDDDKLADELANIEIDLSDFDFEFGDDDDDVDDVVESEPPEPPKEPTSKRGDVWQLGNHRLMCGDSSNADDVKTLMNGVVAEIEITSPPYNVGDSAKLSGYNGSGDDCKYISGDDDRDDYFDLLDATTENALNHVQYAFINLQMLANNKIDMIEWLNQYKNNLCDIIIWNKGHGTPQLPHNVLNCAFEFIFVFNKSNNTRAIGTKDFHGNIDNVIDISKQHNNEYSDIHNATFPIEFPTFFVSHFTNKNENVLDLFGGTGTTLIACEQLNRNCYTMELEPAYCDVIIERWETFTGQKAVLIQGGD